MKPMDELPTKLDTLRRQMAQLAERSCHAHWQTIATGCGPLDRLLPAGGFRRGTLIEWLGSEIGASEIGARGEGTSGGGSGAATLAFMAAAEACRDGKSLVVIDHDREFYPPAAVRLGIAPDRLIVVQTTAGDQNSKADRVWALDQALRCPAVAAVVAWPEKIDGHAFRRWQLAAEESGVMGFLIRGASARNEPSWADVRLLAEPLPRKGPVACYESSSRCLRIRVLRCRGGVDNRSVEVEIDDETYPVPSTSELAHSTAHRRAARA